MPPYDDGVVQKVFEEYRDSTDRILKHENLISALRAMKLSVQGEISMLRDFRTMHLDCQNGLTLQEFKEYLSCRRPLLEEYIRHIPFWKLISDSISAQLDLKHESEMSDLRCMAFMSSDDIDSVVEALRLPLKELLTNQCQHLTRAFIVSQNSVSGNDKFGCQVCREADSPDKFPVENSLAERVGESTYTLMIEKTITITSLDALFTNVGT